MTKLDIIDVIQEMSAEWLSPRKTKAEIVESIEYFMDELDAVETRVKYFPNLSL